jgi:hypothetical protein
MILVCLHLWPVITAPTGRELIVFVSGSKNISLSEFMVLWFLLERKKPVRYLRERSCFCFFLALFWEFSVWALRSGMLSGILCLILRKLGKNADTGLMWPFLVKRGVDANTGDHFDGVPEAQPV